jgi:phosphoribosylformylglycinamidine synthase subunit PurQ / glutaminase
MKQVKALVLTGYGLNCDYETDFALKAVGADSQRVHINSFIGKGPGENAKLDPYHLLVVGGGFSWADDHGAGVLMATKLKQHLGKKIERFLSEGKLVLGVCNGFQCLVNLGLLPGLEGNYKRQVALTHNEKGNFIDSWVKLKINTDSPCVFTKGIETLELPARHGEGKFFAQEEILNQLFANQQVVMQYADRNGELAQLRWPENPNGSLRDIAGICDPTGRIFGLMPHPEAFNHFTNHPDWTRKKEERRRGEGAGLEREGLGMGIFRNAVEYAKGALL